MPGFTLSVQASVADFQRRVEERQRRQIPFVTAYALTKTAQDVKRDEVQVMAQVFDRPTRFTLNALYVRPATKQTLLSEVFFKEGFGSIPAWRYLGPQVEGGPRAKKSHERALEAAGILRSDEFVVPGLGVPRDAYGNVPGSVFTRILSQLQASRDPAQNMTQRSSRRAISRAGGKYFVLRGVNGIPPGIYQRSTGNRYSTFVAGTIVPMLIFVKAPQYAKRFPFFETARNTFQRNFSQHFSEGWQRYVVARAVSRAA